MHLVSKLPGVWQYLQVGRLVPQITGGETHPLPSCTVAEERNVLFHVSGIDCCNAGIGRVSHFTRVAENAPTVCIVYMEQCQVHNIK